MAQDHSQHKQLTKGDVALFSGIGIGGAVIASPYLLPMVGIGKDAAEQVIGACAANVGEFGKGAAGIINNGFAQFGEAGQALAAGGWTSAIASGAIGLGGVLLGNYIEEHFDKEGQIPWGKVIKYAAITTSVLIALPSILSGITLGLTFLSFAIGGAGVGSAVGGALSSTLGYMGATHGAEAALSGLAGLLPHLVTCGLGILPVVGTALLAKNTGHHDEKPHNQLQEVDFRQRLRDVHQLAVSQ